MVLLIAAALVLVPAAAAPDEQVTSVERVAPTMSSLQRQADVESRQYEVVQFTSYVKAVQEAQLIAYAEAVEHAQWHAEQERLAAARRAAARERAAAAPAAVQSRSVPGGSVWDRLAQCESGGNWSINTGNGYYGGLQFNLQTWQSYGGTGYPHQHSRETQIAVAERLHAARGFQPWPACSRKLGLR
jgi:hypothetical protein